MGRMAQALNLTDDQKAQAKQIFQDAATAGKPLRDQMKQARQALQAAAKNNAANAQIDQLSQQLGVISGQLAANQARAFGKFYSILTPEQRQKLDTLNQNRQNGGFRPAAFRNRARWGQQTESQPQPQQ
jgi:Spy/CpxP family protein refolding chaperone